MFWRPVGAEAFGYELSIAPGRVRQINPPSWRRRIEAQAEEQHKFAIRRALWDALNTTWLRGEAQIHFRFTGKPGIARERIEFALGAARRTIGRRDGKTTRAVNGF